MRKFPIRTPQWIAACIMIGVIAGSAGYFVNRTAARNALGQDKEEPAIRRDSLGTSRVDQATPQIDLPWHFQVLDQAGGATGPVVVAGSMAYVGRGPVVAVADLSDDEHPRWVGQSAALDGAVTELALTEGHLLALVGNDGYAEHLVSLSLDHPLTPLLVGQMTMTPDSMGLFATSGRAWLSQRQRHERFGTIFTVAALTVDASGAIVGQEVWRSTSSGWTLPSRAPIVRSMAPDLMLVAAMPADDLDDALWSFSLDPDGRWLPRARLPLRFGDAKAMTVDEPRRRVFVSSESMLTVFDVMADGFLQERGSMTLGSSTDCGGLTWAGGWLVASSGCDGAPSATLIEVTDPDRPRHVADIALHRSVARLAQAGDRWVATGGDLGGLTILGSQAPASLTALGYIQDPPAVTDVVSTAQGRFGIAAGLGIVRLGSPLGAGWAQSELVYPLPDVTSLEPGPEAQLVASEAPGRPSPAELHLLDVSGGELRLRRRIALEARWAGNLTVVGNDLYLGLSEGLAWPPTVAPIQRWSFGLEGLTLQSRTDPKVTGTCYVVGDQVYVALSSGMVALDRNSLTPLLTVGTDQREDDVCQFALRSDAGSPPRFVKSNNDTLFIQRIDGKSLKTIGQLAWPGPDWPRTGPAKVRDLQTQVAAIGANGLFLVDSRSETDLRPLAYLPLFGLDDLIPIESGSPSFAPGRRWVVSSARFGLLLVTTVASTASAPPFGPTVRPWARPTFAPARPQPTATTALSDRRVYLPMVIDQDLAAWPRPFAELRSIGPTFRAVAAEGEHAWVGDGLTLAMLTHDGEAARITDRSANLPAAPRLLATGKDLLVAVAGSRGLYLLNRPTDAAPELLGHLELPDRVVDIGVVSDHAYVATAFCGIFTIDLSRPARPRVLSVLGVPETPTRLIATKGWLLSFDKLASNHSTRIAVASLSSPSSPEWVREQTMPSFSMLAAATDGDRVFIANAASENDTRVNAYEVAPDGALTEIQAWWIALQDAPGSWGELPLIDTMAASSDWLLLSGYNTIVAIARSAVGLPERVTSWTPGPRLQLTSVTLAGDSAIALTRGGTAGASFGGPDSATLGGLLWVGLESLMATGFPNSPADTWISDFPIEPAMVVRFGATLCVGPNGGELGGPAWWLAIDATEPQRVKPLGRMDLPADIHWMLPTGTNTALALRWVEETEVGSILRLDVSEVMHPKVLSEISLQGSFPVWAIRSGDLVAVRTRPDGLRGSLPDSYTLVADAVDKPLDVVASIASPEGTFNSRFFIDGGRGYLSANGADYQRVDGAYYPVYRTMVFDLLTRPPRYLGDLPFPVTALKRIGGDVFALVNDPIHPQDSFLATVSLTDPPDHSTLRQRIDLRGSVPLSSDPGAVLNELTTVPDGELIWPVQTGGVPEAGQSNFMLMPLHLSDSGQSWLAGTALPLDLAGFKSPSLNLVNGWLAFLGSDGPMSERGLLHLTRIAP